MGLSGGGGGGSVGLVAKWLPTRLALLSLTFLQTLPELVTPLKGHILYLRPSAHRRCTVAAPSKRFGHGPIYRSTDLSTNKTVEAMVQREPVWPSGMALGW